MDFKTHYLGLPVNERESLAQQSGTTRGTLNQLVYGGKRIELGLADCLVALCEGVTLDGLPLTDRAQQQRAVREGRNATDVAPGAPATETAKEGA